MIVTEFERFIESKEFVESEEFIEFKECAIVFKRFRVFEQSVSIDFKCLFHLLSSLETDASSEFMIFVAVDATFSI